MKICMHINSGINWYKLKQTKIKSAENVNLILWMTFSSILQMVYTTLRTEHSCKLSLVFAIKPNSWLLCTEKPLKYLQ